MVNLKLLHILMVLCLLFLVTGGLPLQAAAGSNILQNPGFESGASGWSQYSSGGYELIYNEVGLGSSGSNWFAYLGGYDAAEEYLYQDITIPADAVSATLELSYNIATDEDATGDYDVLIIQVADPPSAATRTNIAYLSNLNDTTVWLRTASLDFSVYKGKTVRLYFNVITDSTLPTEFMIDDLSMTVTTPVPGSKPGDCDYDGTVTIAELQSAINMFLGMKSVANCVDQDGIGGVTIAEVQKAINAFLGM